MTAATPAGDLGASDEEDHDFEWGSRSFTSQIATSDVNIFAGLTVATTVTLTVLFAGFGQVIKRLQTTSHLDAAAISANPHMTFINADATWKSMCTSFACGEYIPGLSCQCNDKCDIHNDCCENYREACFSSSAVVSSSSSGSSSRSSSSSSSTTTIAGLSTTATVGDGCWLYGCVGFTPRNRCQCHQACREQNNCCSDFPNICAIISCTISELPRDIFPGEVLKAYQRFDPMFEYEDMMADSVNCSSPDPCVYFANSKEHSYPLFHNEMQMFPMAMDYMDTSSWRKPEQGHFQTVLGFAEMQSPYYQYLGDMYRGDTEPVLPYLVMSMGKGYSSWRNARFVECGLLGWPGYPRLAPGEYPMRLVLKNAHHGEHCTGVATGHAWCTLSTSWGNAAANVWRPTAMEVNTLIKLCTFKYHCDIVKGNMTPRAGKQAPQVFLFKVRRDPWGFPLRVKTMPATTS